jgi:hypothetical protein
MKFLGWIWSTLVAAWDLLVFAVEYPWLAVVIVLVTVILVLWLGKKILTAPLKLAWMGIVAGARRVPGLVASEAKRIPGLASKAKGAAVAGARSLPQARQLITGSRRNFAIVGVVVAVLLIGLLYWSLSGTRPAPPAQTAKEWVAKAREYLPPWLGGKPPSAPSGPGNATPGGTPPPVDIWKFQPQPKPEPRSFDLTDRAKQGLGEIKKGAESGEISKSVVESGERAIKKGKNLFKATETDVKKRTREEKEKAELQDDQERMEEALKNLKKDTPEAQR